MKGETNKDKSKAENKAVKDKPEEKKKEEANKNKSKADKDKAVKDEPKKKKDKSKAAEPEPEPEPEPETKMKPEKTGIQEESVEPETLKKLDKRGIQEKPVKPETHKKLQETGTQEKPSEKETPKKLDETGTQEKPVEPETQKKLEEKPFIKLVQIFKTKMTFFAVIILFLLVSVYIKSEKGREIATTINILQSDLCQNHYKEHFFKISLVPWSNAPESFVSMENMFIEQSLYTKNEENPTLLDFFNFGPEASSRRLLLVGEQGTGKTTAVRRSTYTWCKQVLKWRYRAFLMLKYTFEDLHKHNDWVPSWEVVFKFLPNLISWMKSATHSVSFVLSFGPKETAKQAQLFAEEVDAFLNGLIMKPLPELLLAFELKNVGGRRKLSEIVHKVANNLSEEKIGKIIEQGSKTVLLILDGYDEYTKAKEGSAEVDALLKREKRKTYSIITTTRPWKSEDILNVRKLGYEEVSLAKLTPDQRNNFIVKYFKHNKPEELAKDLITALQHPDSAVPKEMMMEPRMLLFICTMWKDNKYIRKDGLLSQDILYEDIWSLMRETYNVKYPEAKITKERLATIKRTIGDFRLEHGENVSYEKFFEAFGEDEGLDLFYFGIYSIDKSYVPTWQREDDQRDVINDHNEVKPAYNEVRPAYSDMIGEEAKKAKEAKKAEEVKKNKTFKTYLWSFFT